MQHQELDQFERLFGGYAGAPEGEPTKRDNELIRAAINHHRQAKRPRRSLYRARLGVRIPNT